MINLIFAKIETAFLGGQNLLLTSVCPKEIFLPTTTLFLAHGPSIFMETSFILLRLKEPLILLILRKLKKEFFENIAGLGGKNGLKFLYTEFWRGQRNRVSPGGVKK